MDVRLGGSDTGTLAVGNQTTGGSTTFEVQTTGTVSVPAGELSGLIEGDELTAQITTELGQAQATATVQAGTIATVSFQEPVTETDDSIVVDVTLGASDFGDLEVFNDRTGEGTFGEVVEDGSIEISAADVGGLAEGDLLVANLFTETESVDTTAVVQAP